MEHVRGLAPRTRRAMLRIVREFLRWRFRDRPVVIPAIKPEHVRSCFVRLTERCHAPASMGAVVSALRGYFRYRASCGDTVYHLIGVLSYPANWQQASLPQTLTDEEVRRLLQSLDSPSPTMRRTAAIVRCAVDLGLRSGEIAALSLDDINWRDGVVSAAQDQGPARATVTPAGADRASHRCLPAVRAPQEPPPRTVRTTRGAARRTDRTRRRAQDHSAGLSACRPCPTPDRTYCATPSRAGCSTAAAR